MGKDMETLIKELVEINADSEQGKEKCVKKLQKISKKLLQEYVICIGDFTIEPLLVEAYYYNEHKGFIDENMHRDNGQMNHFGELYFHKSGRGGADICLSNGKYFLSFLIKNSLVTNGNKEVFYRQTYLEELREEYNKSSEKFVLKKREVAKDSIVFYTVRKGLVMDNSFKDKKLAAVTGFELRDENQKRYRFDLETGHSKTVLLKEYIKETVKSEIDEEKIKELCSGLIAKDTLNDLLK